MKRKIWWTCTDCDSEPLLFPETSSGIECGCGKKMVPLHELRRLAALKAVKHDSPACKEPITYAGDSGLHVVMGKGYSGTSSDGAEISRGQPLDFMQS